MGEKEITGDNFDTNINRASKNEKDFNLKKILDRPAKGEVKFSERIKSKVRDLKALQ